MKNITALAFLIAIGMLTACNPTGPINVNCTATTGTERALPEASRISTAEVEAAQQGWGEGIVKIGKAENPRKAALEHLDQFYAFDQGPVLFKPTLAATDQFRGTRKEALSYFIGGDLAEDKGFALAPYTKVRWENEGIITDGDSAMAMGNYFFTKTNGEEVKVEYSFGYIKDAYGDVKINLHHSSLPFSAD